MLSVAFFIITLSAILPSVVNLNVTALRPRRRKTRDVSFLRQTGDASATGDDSIVVFLIVCSSNYADVFSSK